MYEGICRKNRLTYVWDRDLICVGSLSFMFLQITFSNYGLLDALNPFSKGGARRQEELWDGAVPSECD